MTKRNKPHLFFNTPPKTDPFTLSGPSGGPERIPFSGNRRDHGLKIHRELDRALEPISEDRAADGTYVSFVSFPGIELALTSLDPQRSGHQPELLSVSEAETDGGQVQLATVFIPAGKKHLFLKKLTEYVETSDSERAKNANLVEGIASIRRATIRELWTDPAALFPPSATEQTWWEVWLRRQDGHALDRFLTYASEHQLLTSDHYLGFGDRQIVLVRASVNELSECLDSLDDISELRKPHDVPSLLGDFPAAEQADWVVDLVRRLKPAGIGAPAVCIIDTGVQSAHPLLAASLSSSDVHVADSSWNSHPVFSHGTEMAGIALFGDLHTAVVGSHDVILAHRLESVKFLPNVGSNQRELYAAITARSVDRPEIEAPERARVFMIAVTAESPEPTSAGAGPIEWSEPGKPTSWSATIDALAYGRSIDDTDEKFTYLDRDDLEPTRLFVISAGNIRRLFPEDDPLSRSDIAPIEDPAQAWNAITVGAYTEKDDMGGAQSIFKGYVPLAPRGELSPTSRTSVMFDRKKWPFKPDVVAEGGNIAVSAKDTEPQSPENLGILTTRRQQLGQGFFTTTRDTSAATASVAAMAATVMAEYPTLRPETVRALIIHSAQWTPPMISHFEKASTKRERVSKLRRYGMGVPDVERALYSASDALTLVAEARIHPYERDGNNASGRAREMNLHLLPWPKQELEVLGDTEVRLRVTLSYFIEPNPSSRGWTGRYAYPSHGLRFAVRRPEESVSDFRKRINSRAREDGETVTNLGGDSEKGWLFGSNQQQSSGSVHTDIWTGPAAELASKEAVAVYPVAGWWKHRPHQDQSEAGVDYSLVVSVESPSVEVDLWTPVHLQISSAIGIMN